MRNFLLLSLSVLLVISIAACGGAADAPTEAPAPTAAPTVAPTTAPPTRPPPTATQDAMEEEPTAMASSGSGASAKLQAYADEHAGGPGAIYIGDINQLVGPAITEDQGDLEGNVPLDALQNHLFVFESDYYRGLLEQANLENPTELVERDEVFTIQHACLNRALSILQSDRDVLFPQRYRAHQGAG